MLHIVTLRTADEAAQSHIVADNCDRSFCGIVVPAFVLLLWGDPRNPYVDKTPTVSCFRCKGEFANGRTYGWAGTGDSMEAPNDPVVSIPDVPQ